MGFVGFPGHMRRYLSGLCVATLGLWAAGWLALAPVAFGYRGNGRPGASLHRAALADQATAAGLAAVSLVTLTCWIVAWRRRLRADGILTSASRRQVRREARAQRRRERDGEPAARPPDPAQVLSELRALLIPLLAEPANGQAANGANGQASGTHPAGEPGPEAPAERVDDQDDQDYDEPGPDYDEPGYHPFPGEHCEDRRPGPATAGLPAVPHARSGGLAAMESILAGAELLMVGCGEEEAW